MTRPRFEHLASQREHLVIIARIRAFTGRIEHMAKNKLSNFPIHALRLRPGAKDRSKSMGCRSACRSSDPSSRRGDAAASSDRGSPGRRSDARPQLGNRNAPRLGNALRSSIAVVRQRNHEGRRSMFGVLEIRDRHRPDAALEIDVAPLRLTSCAGARDSQNDESETPRVDAVMTRQLGHEFGHPSPVEGRMRHGRPRRFRRPAKRTKRRGSAGLTMVTPCGSSVAAA